MRMSIIELLHPRVTLDHLGFLPEILLSDDPRPVKDQLEERYAHGGGYRPMKDSKFKLVREGFSLKYPGDPLYRPIAKFIFPKTKEVAFFYQEGSFLCIVQDDGAGDYVVTRVD